MAENKRAAWHIAFLHNVDGTPTSRGDRWVAPETAAKVGCHRSYIRDLCVRRVRVYEIYADTYVRAGGMWRDFGMSLCARFVCASTMPCYWLSLTHLFHAGVSSSAHVLARLFAPTFPV